MKRTLKEIVEVLEVDLADNIITGKVYQVGDSPDVYGAHMTICGEGEGEEELEYSLSLMPTNFPDRSKAQGGNAKPGPKTRKGGKR